MLNIFVDFCFEDRLHVRLAFAGPVSSARRLAVAQSSSEPCPSSGLKTLPAIAAHRGR